MYMIVYIFCIFAKNTIMETLTINKFRSNMATTLNKVDKGERIVLQRNSKRYTIVPLDDSDLTITPELQERLEESRKEIMRGESTICRTHEEIDTFFDSL
ncbi:MAG: hypothetical protein E7076_07920 [Bacteroidales bacterium]|nr:hypothetical protein [Bacteroidales bacterium]